MRSRMGVPLGTGVVMIFGILCVAIAHDNRLESQGVAATEEGRAVRI